MLPSGADRNTAILTSTGGHFYKIPYRPNLRLNKYKLEVSGFKIQASCDRACTCLIRVAIEPTQSKLLLITLNGKYGLDDTNRRCNILAFDK